MAVAKPRGKEFPVERKTFLTRQGRNEGEKLVSETHCPENERNFISAVAVFFPCIS
jgi:hypothetical protein